MTQYQLVSADSHVNEPPDLWADRVPARYKDRAPRMESFEQGDAWVLEGAHDPINFGGNCSAGLPIGQRSGWVRWDDVRAGGYDPAARIGEQDQDGVDLEILYPTPRIGNQLVWHRDDVDFHIACIRAYNDWLAEFCSYNSDRLWGVALLPNVGAEDAVAELRRAAALPGIRGVMLGRWPSGDEVLSEDDDPVFAAAAEARLPLSIHVGFATHAQGDVAKMKLTGSMRFFDMPVRITQLIEGGVFDRFGDLQFLAVETDSSWFPYLREQMDDRFRRANPATRAPIQRSPGDYFDTNIASTFITDHYGIVNRHHIGVTQMMWSSDFPHGGSDWPDSRTTISEHFDGVPDDERHAILAGNALRIYGQEVRP